MAATNVKLVAVGDGAVGKTSLLMIFNVTPFPERSVPTIFGHETQNMTILDTPCKLRNWDTAGQDDYDRLRPLSYRGANGILLCFALDSQQLFVNLTDRWIGEVKHYCPNAKVILMGTKSDLRQAGNANHVTNDEARGFQREQKHEALIACPPKSGEGADQAFLVAIKACRVKKKGGWELP
jgi:small GTP-binding protein